MSIVNLTINEKSVEVPAGTTILQAARSADIYILTLCSHPDLPPANGIRAANFIYQGKHRLENTGPEEIAKSCGLCLVEVKGEVDLVESCSAPVKDGMLVVTENNPLKIRRQENLIPILARHCHACLTCAQKDGCSLTQCSSNVPENERCCSLFGHCELQNVANYIGISDVTPKWVPTSFPLLKNDPLFEHDYNLCIGCTRCVRACNELKGVEALGFIYDENDLLQVGSIGPTLEESGCKFCTACVEVCPTGALLDKAVRPGRKEEDIVPCRTACPADIDIPGYLRLIAEGKRDEAHTVIREKVPFPGILGRVCAHPCEDACRSKEVNESIAICVLKRYAADGDKGLWKKHSQVRNNTGKKVAIVGSGPAGLSAAFYLRKQGHSVTVFETRAKAGGMMRYGIPTYRLPPEVLNREINDILSLDIDFRHNQCLGVDFTLDQLRKSYDAIFLAVGAQLSHHIAIYGSDSPDVLWGIDFLRQVASGKDIHLKDRIIVIGGGDVAVDVALTALRCGAEEVTMVCLESREEMPAHELEIEGAMAEGVKLMPAWGPKKILHQNGEISGIKLVRCAGVFDGHGNFNPTFTDRVVNLEGDQIIMAVGQTTDLSFLKNGSSSIVKNGLIDADHDTHETGLKGVYAGGDVTDIAGAIIDAIAQGRRAATAIDKALGGNGDIEETLFPRNTPSQHLGRDKGFVSRPREKSNELDIQSGSTGFAEIHLGYEDDQAVREAQRCLQCDLRLYLECNPDPPAKWLRFDAETVTQIPETEGVLKLLDDDNNILVIKGIDNLKRHLLEALSENENATKFEFEENKMYSQRESELIQQHLQEHGEMPGGGDSELDDLF